MDSLTDHKAQFTNKPTGFDRKLDRRSFGEPLAALRSVKIVDSGEPLVDLRVAYPELTFRPGCLPFLRESVAAKAYAAHKSMPEGYTLIVSSCLRTIEMQRETQKRIRTDLVEKHPEWTKATLHRMLNRMVAPPDDISPPPHTTGGAMDIGVKDAHGKDLDFNSPLEGWWSAAPTFSPGLSATARHNRLMVVEVMEGVGFTNYVGEWWHWSYGDQGWALRVGSTTAYYGSIGLDDAESKRVPEPPKDPLPEVVETAT